jgi:hypothetical protein
LFFALLSFTPFWLIYVFACFFFVLFLALIDVFVLLLFLFFIPFPFHFFAFRLLPLKKNRLQTTRLAPRWPGSLTRRHSWQRTMKHALSMPRQYEQAAKVHGSHVLISSDGT